jgi:DNA-binding CsgD family transcriptional regulator
VTEVSRELLEREDESAAVRAAVADAAAGRGCVLLVEGEAGVGKSRLLAEVRSAAVDAGIGVLSAGGVELEREFPFGVVRQLMEPVLQQADEDARGRLFAGPAAQARWVFGLEDPAPSGHLAGDLAVVHGLYWLVANLCQDRPLVLVVDDLHWCDVASLRFLAHLLPRAEGMRLLLAAAVRAGEPAPDDRLLGQVVADPVVWVLRPGPLSPHATGTLLNGFLGTRAEPAFAAACHEATGGNPLLLRELTRTVVAQRLQPTAANAALVPDLGPQAVARLVTRRMATLSPAAIALARAVAVLGGRSPLTTAAALAGRDPGPALADAVVLESRGILRVEREEGLPTLSFLHPLVLAAVYDAMDHAERARAHGRAAEVLIATGAGPERIATHLLHVPPAGDERVAAVLAAAADRAAVRRASQSAFTYLRRALHEPPPAEQHLPLLIKAGQAALTVDLVAAARYLRQAYDETADPVAGADLAAPLGSVYAFLMEADRGLALWEEAGARLPADQEGRRRLLQANLLSAATWLAAGRGDMLARAAQWSRLPYHDSVGGRLLDCAVATRQAATCDPAGIDRARRALRDGVLVREAIGDLALTGGWATLMCADDEEVLTASLDDGVRQAHLHGSVYALVPAYAARGITWLWRGHLSEAEQDVQQALHFARLGNFHLGLYTSQSWESMIQVERGRLDEAEAGLSRIDITEGPPAGPVPMALMTVARLRTMRGEPEAALDAALRARRGFEAFDWHPPLWASWRFEAAQALHALGRIDEARAMAAEELRRARRWGRPHYLGRALRVTAQVTGWPAAPDLLREAVAALDGSPARLEHAKALAALGSTLLLSGHRRDARPPLRQALDLALGCGADGLAGQVKSDLTTAGGRPRHTALSGPDALTPSERRVVDLAVDGHTNRHIAERLFVTPKTVEVHLSASYRKLGITTRAQLADALGRGRQG